MATINSQGLTSNSLVLVTLVGTDFLARLSGRVLGNAGVHYLSGKG